MICYCNGAEATDVLDREIKRKGGASVKCHIEMFGGGGAVKSPWGNMLCNISAACGSSEATPRNRKVDPRM